MRVCRCLNWLSVYKWALASPSPSRISMAQLIPFAELTGGTVSVRFTVINGGTSARSHTASLASVCFPSLFPALLFDLLEGMPAQPGTGRSDPGFTVTGFGSSFRQCRAAYSGLVLMYPSPSANGVVVGGHLLGLFWLFWGLVVGLRRVVPVWHRRACTIGSPGRAGSRACAWSGAWGCGSGRESDRTSIISSDYHRNGRYQFTQCLNLSLLNFLEPLFSQVVKLVKQYIWRRFLVISQDGARSTLELADSC